MATPNLIIDLQQKIQTLIETTEQVVLNQELKILQWKSNSDSWSILECYEHLNIYNRFYNAELEKALLQDQSPQAFVSGWLGNYFVKMISPSNIKPMKTMKHVDPINSDLTLQVIEEFLQHQKHLLKLLAQTKNKNLNPRKIRVEFFRLLKIKIGDGFRFVVAHQERHMNQILKTKKDAILFQKENKVTSK